MHVNEIKMCLQRERSKPHVRNQPWVNQAIQQYFLEHATIGPRGTPVKIARVDVLDFGRGVL